MRQVAFGEFTYDFQSRLLLEGQNPVDLGTRAAALLDRLLQRRGDVVPKAELIDAAWGNIAVEESNLSVQIAALRRALGRDAAGHDWIATVERVGYRFRLAPSRAAVRVVDALPGLEVGLFLDGSDRRTLAERPTEALLAGLAPASSLCAGQVGELGGVPDYRLTGTVETTGGTTEICMHLADVPGGHVLWTRALSIAPGEDLADPLRQLASQIEERVFSAETYRSAVERPGSTALYDRFLRARALIRTGRHDDNARAFGLLADAIEEAPNNSRFLAAAAESLHTRRLVGWPELTGRDQELRLAFARRAWEASENDPDSLSLAGNAMFTSGEPELGLSLTALAAEKHPYSAAIVGCAGHSHQWIGQLEDAQALYERAIALSPTGTETRFAYSNLAGVLNIIGRPDEALRVATRGWAISSGYSGMHWQMMVANLALGRTADAKRSFDTYREMHPQATLDNIRVSQPHRDPQRTRPLIDTLKELGLPRR